MSHSDAKGTRDALIGQLVYFDEQVSSFLDEYSDSARQDRVKLRKLIERYQRKLQDVTSRNDDRLDESLRSVVLIGSSVKIEFPEDSIVETYTLAFPEHIDPDQNRISFLSPLGISLLLGSVADSVTVEGPGGNYVVHVQEVNFAENAVYAMP